VKKFFRLLVLGQVLLIALTAGRTATAATCYGLDPCNACKTCRYCKHCAKEGGACGVCKRQRAAQAKRVRPQAKVAPLSPKR
jgi:hypothetical protein